MEDRRPKFLATADLELPCTEDVEVPARRFWLNRGPVDSILELDSEVKDEATKHPPPFGGNCAQFCSSTYSSAKRTVSGNDNLNSDKGKGNDKGKGLGKCDVAVKVTTKG